MFYFLPMTKNKNEKEAVITAMTKNIFNSIIEDKNYLINVS